MSNDLSDGVLSELELVSSEPDKSHKKKPKSSLAIKQQTLEKPKNPVGRPSKYQDSFPAKLIEIAKNKEVFDFHATVCAMLGISRDTLAVWVNENEKFSEAYRDALEIWKMRLAEYVVYNRLDYRLYRCFTHMATGVDIEPKTVTQTEHLACIIPYEQLVELNGKSK